MRNTGSGDRHSLTPALLGWACPIELLYLSLHWAPGPSAQIALVLLAYATGACWSVWMLRRIHRLGGARPTRATWFVIVSASVVFRATLFPLTSATSGDVARYRWEGILQEQGYNPYINAPDDAELQPLADQRGALHDAVSHRHLPSIYPPTAQWLFGVNAIVFGATLAGWKAILLLFDALLSWSVWLFLKRRDAPLTGMVLLLWSPLLLLETYEGGHLDVIGVALLAAAVIAMDRGRWCLSAAALAFSLHVKYLWPALALIVLLAEAARRRRALPFLMVVVALSSILWWPYRSGIQTALTTVATFADTWSFNGVLFSQLRRLPGPAWLPTALVLLLLGALAIILVRSRTGTLWSNTWLLVGTALVWSPVAYPWYFLWIVPGLVWRPPGWLVVWVLSVGALHIVGWWHWVSGEWVSQPWVEVGILLTPLSLLCRTWWQRFTHNAPLAPRPSTHQRLG